MSYCTWTIDAGGAWRTSCNQAHAFTAGGPQENGYKFCPYCGRQILDKPHVEKIERRGRK